MLRFETGREVWKLFPPSFRCMPQKPTNISLPEALVPEAKALRVNLLRAAEADWVREVTVRRAELWKNENRDALESSNKFVEQNGLPLVCYRSF